MFYSRLIAAIAIASALLLFAGSVAEARSRHHHHVGVRVYIAHPDCNVKFPCEGVVASPRGEAIVRTLGFGAAQKIYKPRAMTKARTRLADASGPVLQPHPDGCPARAFCGCGAIKRLETAWGFVVAKPRELWLAAAWLRFPRAAPAAGMVAVRHANRHRSGHVFVLEAPLGGDLWQVYDANSGGHATRIHARSIAGYTIVNPHAGVELAWRA